MTAPVSPSQPRAEPVRQDAPVCDYLIRRNGGFYRPRAAGYTMAISEAGRWPKSEALAYQRGVEGVTIHHVSEFKPDEIMVLKARIQELEKSASIKDELLERWIAYAEEELSEFDLEICESEDLCHGCQSAGCINLRIRESRAALEAKPAGEKVK